MSFFRPEATAALRRYGEPVAYLVLGGWGLIHGTTLILRGTWTGWVLVGLGVLAALSLFGAAERALVAWRSQRAGPGTVSIREGQIAYFGPLGGAILAMDALTGVDIHNTGQGDIIWILTDEIGQIAEIPGGADGAVALLDRLGALKGFDHGRVVSAMRTSTPQRFVIWRRAPQPSLSGS